MCNAFNTAKKPGSEEVRLIRRTDKAPVILPGGDVAEMRWGFERKGLGVINNTRSDNLESQVWREAFRERRCLVPLSSYFEWTGSQGNKRTHRFQDPEGRSLFAAGIWEESGELGVCFSMLTTDASAFVSAIHHRMPALLTEARQGGYLRGEMLEFDSFGGLLAVEETVNPLLKNPPTHWQGDLFG